MPEHFAPSIGWAFGSFFRIDKLAADFAWVQYLAYGAVGAGIFFLYSSWRKARTQNSDLAATTLERLGCNRLMDPSAFQEGAEITLHAAGKAGGVNLDARVGAIRRGLLEVWVDGGDHCEAIEVGMPVELWKPSPAGGLQFQAVVIDKRTEPNGLTLMVERPHWLANFQRRRFRRFQVVIPAVISVPQKGHEDNSARRALIDDLSGGGFRMTAAQPLTPGTSFQVAFAGPETTESRLSARVLSCTESKRRGDDVSFVQCEFVNLSDGARKAIIDYCVTSKLSSPPRMERSAA